MSLYVGRTGKIYTGDVVPNQAKAKAGNSVDKKQFDQVILSATPTQEQETAGVDALSKHLKYELRKGPRAETIEGLRRAVQEGSYKVDPDQVAKNLLL